MKRVPVFKNTKNKSYKTEDGIIYNSRSCAVVCHVIFVVNNVPHYLIGKRGSGVDHSGKLNVPCGYFDWDENLRQAFARELWEETSLDIESYVYSVPYKAIDQPWSVYTEIDENKQNIALHCGIVVYSNELPVLSLENMEDDESEAASWISIADLMGIPKEDFAFNHKAKIIRFITDEVHNYIYMTA